MVICLYYIILFYVITYMNMSYCSITRTSTFKYKHNSYGYVLYLTINNFYISKVSVYDIYNNLNIIF